MAHRVRGDAQAREGDELACKPDPVVGLHRPVIIHLGLPLPTASCGLPAGIERATRLRSSASFPSPRLLTLLRVGFAKPPQSPAVLVVSYTTVSPLPGLLLAVCSLWHFPAGRPGWELPTTLPCGVRTFLDTFMPRSPGQLVHPKGTATVTLVLILLPPSEGKTAPHSGRPVAWRSLAFPELTTTRKQVCAAVDPSLAKAHAAPAIEIYSGVLYAALDAASLTATQRARLDEQVLISSALFGLVRPGDRIPSYSLPAASKVRGLGSLTTLWREQVSHILAASARPILDLRSGAYQAFVAVPHDSCAVGRVLLERNGKRSVVSHHNKATKGRAVRALVSARTRHRSIADIAATLEEAGMTCEFHENRRGPATLDIVTFEL